MIRYKIIILSILFFSNILSQVIIEKEFNKIIIEYNSKHNWKIKDNLKIYNKKRHIADAKIIKINDKILAVITHDDPFYPVKVGDTVKKYWKGPTYTQFDFEDGFHVGINSTFNEFNNPINIGLKIGLTYARESRQYFYFEPSIKISKGVIRNKEITVANNLYEGDFYYNVNFFDLAFLYHQNFRLAQRNYFLNFGPSLNISLFDDSNKPDLTLIYKDETDNFVCGPHGQRFFFENSYLALNLGFGFTLFDKPIEIRYTSSYLRYVTQYRINEKLHEITIIIVPGNWID